MEKEYFVGIDIGATNTKLGIVNLEGEITKQKKMNSKIYSPKRLLEKLSREIKKFKDRYKIKATGVGLAGPTDSFGGKVYYFVNLPGWEGLPVADILKVKTGLETFIDNDTNVMALAEHSFGAGHGFKNLICLTLGSGVGGGIILNNELYRGSNLVAGEIGHIPINFEGPNCRCGGRGCLERYVGSEFIIERTINKIKEGNRSVIMKLVENDKAKITPEIIDKAYKQGDKLAKEIWIETGKFIGIALSGVVNLFNPEVIIIGGGVSKVGKILFDSVYETIHQQAMKIHKKDIRILPAQLGENAGVVGAAVLAKQEIAHSKKRYKDINI